MVENNTLIIAMLNAYRWREIGLCQWLFRDESQSSASTSCQQLDYCNYLLDSIFHTLTRLSFIWKWFEKFVGYDALQHNFIFHIVTETPILCWGRQEEIKALRVAPSDEHAFFILVWHRPNETGTPL